MKLIRRLAGNEEGVAVIEMAFALPILLSFIWMFMQFAQVYRALAGMQQGLGEGARLATLCATPTSAGCATPTAADIEAKINSSVYGIGPGTFTVTPPAKGTSGTGNYYELKVTYSQPTDMLFFTGPTVTVTRSKRVWVAGA